MQRKTFDELIANQVNDTITAARETLSETGLTPNDLESIVWIGDTTHYKLLKDKVSSELGIDGDFLVNPITAFAEGASIFAESIFGHSEYPSTIENTKKDIMERRDRLFDANVGMDLLQNSFYILNATQRENRHRIIELAEKQSLLSDADKCMEARAELTNPRKRVSAEVAWLPGVVPERIYDVLLLLELSAGNRLGRNNTISTVSVASLASALACLSYDKKSNIADEVLETLKLPNRGLQGSRRVSRHPYPHAYSASEFTCRAYVTFT